jgi:hypothetical protein
MEPSLTSAAVGIVSIGSFAVGITQIVKDLGVQGQVLKLVCILAGTIAWGVMTLYPALWAEISVLLIALSSTGLVSFGDERLQNMKSPR